MAELCSPGLNGRGSKSEMHRKSKRSVAHSDGEIKSSRYARPGGTAYTFGHAGAPLATWQDWNRLKVPV